MWTQTKLAVPLQCEPLNRSDLRAVNLVPKSSVRARLMVLSNVCTSLSFRLSRRSGNNFNATSNTTETPLYTKALEIAEINANENEDTALKY